MYYYQTEHYGELENDQLPVDVHWAAGSGEALEVVAATGLAIGYRRCSPWRSCGGSSYLGRSQDQAVPQAEKRESGEEAGSWRTEDYGYQKGLGAKLGL